MVMLYVSMQQHLVCTIVVLHNCARIAASDERTVPGQARDELNLNGKASTNHTGALSPDIRPILETSQEGLNGTDGPSTSDSYVEINSQGGTLPEASDLSAHARMHSWDRANSGRLTPAAGGSGGSAASAVLEGTAGNISVWKPSPTRPAASMELSPFDAAVRDRGTGHYPPPLPAPAAAPAAGTAVTAAAHPAMDDIGMEELRTVLAGRAARAADGESHGVVGTPNRPAEHEAIHARAPSTEAPMGLDDLASMMGRKPRRPIMVPPLSPPRSPAAAASFEPGRCSGTSTAASAEQAQPPAAAEPGQVQQDLPAIPQGSLAELYLRQLCQEEAAEDAASAGGTCPSSDFLSGRSLVSEAISEQSGRRSSAASDGSTLSGGALRSGSSGRGRPGVADVLMRGGEHSLGSSRSGRGAGSARTSSDLHDERIIAEEQRDAPDGLADLDELFARCSSPPNAICM